jgi:hypothetical protein
MNAHIYSRSDFIKEYSLQDFKKIGHDDFLLYEQKRIIFEEHCYTPSALHI